MGPSTPFIRRPIGTTLLTFGLAAAGAVAFFKLPVSPLPQVDFPTISVQATLPGASPQDVATRYNVVVSTVHMWRRRGLLRAHPVNDRGDFLYEIPPEGLPGKFVHKRDYQVDPATSSSRN